MGSILLLFPLFKMTAWKEPLQFAVKGSSLWDCILMVVLRSSLLGQVSDKSFQLHSSISCSNTCNSAGLWSISEPGTYFSDMFLFKAAFFS